MNSQKCLVYVVASFGLFNCLLLHASFSKADLDTAYKKAQGELTGFENQVVASQGLPQDQQTILKDQISNAQTQVQVAYDQASQNIKNISSTGYFAKMQTEQYVQTALNGINRATALVKNAIEQSQDQLHWTVARTEATTELQEKSAAQVKFETDIQQLMKSLEPTLSLLSAAVDQTRSALPSAARLGGINYNAAAIQKVNDMFEQAAQTAVAAYKTFAKNNSSAESATIVVDILSHWGSFYGIVVNQELLVASENQKQASLYYKLLAQAAGHVQGTKDSTLGSVQMQGYVKTIQAAYNNYLPNNSSGFSSFMQMMVNKIYQPLRIGLNNIVTRNSNPTSQEIEYAQAYYQALISMMDNTTASDTQHQEIAADMAFIYLNFAKTIIKKSMKVGVDNNVLRAQVQKAYSSAADNFSQAGTKFASEAALYKNMASALAQADNWIGQAQTAQLQGNFSLAVTAYQNALTQLNIGSDTADSAFVAAALAQAQAGQTTQQVHQSIQALQLQQGTALAQLITLLTQGQASQSPVPFFGALQALQKVVQSLVSNYQRAQQGYQLLQHRDKATFQELNKIEAQSTGALGVSNMLQALLACVQEAQDGTQEALFSAETLYHQAQSLAILLDQEIAQQKNVSYTLLSLPFLIPTAQGWTYQQLVDRLTAQLYVWIAQSATDALVAVQYYTYAQKRAYLSTALQQSITHYFKLVVQKQKDLEALKDRAAQEEQQAEQYGTQDWQPATDQKFYLSKANSLWQAVLSDYWSAYSLGNGDSLSLFIKAAQRYEVLYQHNVPAVWFPQAGAAFLSYSLSLALRKAGNEAEANQEELNNLTPLIQQFMQQGKNLVEDVDAASVTLSVKPDLTMLASWVARAEQLILDQEVAIITYVGTNNSTVARLLIKTSQTQDAVTYQDTVTKTSVTVPDLTMRTAIIYKQLAENAFASQKYSLAIDYYKISSQAYMALHDIDHAQALVAPYELATTLFYASFYEDSIVEQGEAKIENFSAVPLSYQLKVYGLEVPSFLALLFPPPVELQTEAERTTFELNLAGQLFLYMSLSSHFNSTQAQALLKLLSGATTNISASLAQAGFTADDQAIVKNVIEQATSFNKDLSMRVKNRTSNLVLETLSTKDAQGNRQYKLWEYNKPIPRIPLVTPPYGGYPDAYTYYYWAVDFYGSQPIQLGSSVFVAGNMPEKVAEIKQKMVNVWLSQGYQMQQKINQLKQSSAYKKLASIDHNDTSISLSSYLPLYNDIADAYGRLTTVVSSVPNPLLLCYGETISLAGLVDPMSSLYASLENLIAQSYKQAGDDLKLFLVGNPLELLYVNAISEIAGYYVTAINQFSYDPLLYLDAGNLYRDAARVVVANKNYFGSVANFMTAQQFYAQAPQSSAITQKAQQDLVVEVASAEFYGATSVISEYAQQRFGQFSLQNVDGSVTSMNFKDLMSVYWNSNAGNADWPASYRAKYDALKKLILNAIIFYTDASALLNDSAAQSSIQQASSGSSSSIEKAATKLVTTYLTQKNLDFSTAQATLAALQQSDFAQLVAQFLNDSLKKFREDTDPQQQALQKRAAGMWADKINNGLNLVYMTDFLGGFSPSAVTFLAADIKARIAANQVNPAQAIG